MKQTQNMQLNKPEYSDVVDVEKLNENFDKIDNKIAEVSGQIVSTVATINKAGLMSASDKIKLDGIATGANKTTVDSVLSASSMNPVQNKVIKVALDGKADTNAATQTSSGLMAAADKVKLDGISAGANKTIVDSAMSEASSNPVQNKVVKQYIDSKAFNGGSGSVTVDTNMSDTSTNPVQNKVIKAYVDAEVGATVYVDFWPVSSEDVYDKDLKAYVVELAASQTFDAIFDSIKSGGKTIARFYSDESKSKFLASSVDANISGDKTLGTINFQFLSAGTNNVAGFAFIGETITLLKVDSKTTIFITANKNVLPTPNADGTDNGKVPTINGKKWELKTPSASDFMITATLASGGAATLDKTFAQIRDAITGGKAVFMQIVDPKGGSTIRASLVIDTPTNLMFSAVNRNGFYSVLNVVSVNSDDSCTVSHETMPVLDSKLALPQLSMASTPDEDMEIATKKYVDDHPAKDAVLYTAQSLTFEQKQQARKNIEAADSVAPTITGLVSMCPDHITDSNVAVHIVPSKVNDSDYTITLDCGPENWPVRVAGIRTPTDAQTDYAANVAYVKAKISEVAASGGVDVDNALSATSTNPVQNKVVKAALDKKAGTAAATTSANGLMSAADKKKLDGIASGATKITIDSTVSGSSNNPVANRVIKQYVDDKVASAGSNITVDATLNATSTNPVQNKVVKSALDGKLSTSGGTLTGNLTGKYIAGTWLQATDASDLGKTPGKIAVLDDSGWVYYRTPSELFADLGITNAIKSCVDSAITQTINNAY